MQRSRLSTLIAGALALALGLVIWTVGRQSCDGPPAGKVGHVQPIRSGDDGGRSVRGIAMMRVVVTLVVVTPDGVPADGARVAIAPLQVLLGRDADVVELAEGLELEKTSGDGATNYDVATTDANGRATLTYWTTVCGWDPPSDVEFVDLSAHFPFGTLRVDVRGSDPEFHRLSESRGGRYRLDKTTMEWVAELSLVIRTH